MLRPSGYAWRSHGLARREQTYVGYTTHLRARLAVHNQGGSVHTAKFRPWQLDAYFALSGKFRALAVEAHLKSHSGKAFAAKRLWSALPEEFQGLALRSWQSEAGAA